MAEAMGRVILRHLVQHGARSLSGTGTNGQTGRRVNSRDLASSRRGR
jgi:hypothetical protein